MILLLVNTMQEPQSMDGNQFLIIYHCQHIFHLSVQCRKFLQMHLVKFLILTQKKLSLWSGSTGCNTQHRCFQRSILTTKISWTIV